MAAIFAIIIAEIIVVKLIILTILQDSFAQIATRIGKKIC